MGVQKKLSKQDQRAVVAASQIEELKTLLSLPLLTEADEEHLRMAASSKQIPFSEVSKARAWLQTKFPEMFEKIHGPSEGDLRLCLDENCPYQMAVDLHRYGRVTSVDLQGWSGKLDPVILGYAKANNIDAIIGLDKAQKAHRVGKDRDLTNAALDMWDSYFRGQPSFTLGKSVLPNSPILVHLTTSHPYRDGTLDTFKREYEKIYDLIKNPTHGIIAVNPSGVKVMRDSCFNRLYRQSQKPKAERGQFDLPREFGQINYVADGLSHARKMNIEPLMQVMREETDEMFRKWIRRRKDPSSNDVYDFITHVLNRVRSHPEVSENIDGLLILEMAVKASRKAAIPERLIKQFESSGMQYNTDVTIAGMRRLSSVEKSVIYPSEDISPGL
jgi:hypothetical protein